MMRFVCTASAGRVCRKTLCLERCSSLPLFLLSHAAKVLNVLEEELPCVRYEGWGNITPSGYFKFDLGAWL